MFGESQSRIIISADKEYEEEILNICKLNNVVVDKIGVTGGDKLKVNSEIDLNLEELNDLYFNSIKYIMEGKN